MSLSTNEPFKEIAMGLFTINILPECGAQELKLLYIIDTCKNNFYKVFKGSHGDHSQTTTSKKCILRIVETNMIVNFCAKHLL